MTNDLIQWDRVAMVAVQLLAAAALGGVLGFQREKAGKEAGFRTHILVCIGAAFFVIVPLQEGIQDVSRVVQGVISGIGFLGGGAILKLANDREIHGLTTAAGIWLTAAVGVAVGFGHLGTAAVATAMAFAILEFLYRIDRWIN